MEDAHLNSAQKEAIKNNSVKPLLTSREIQKIVKDFSIAYISGQIQLKICTSTDYKLLAKEQGRKISTTDAMMQEVKFKKHLSDNIAICLGIRQATPEELQQAITVLFDLILTFRNGNRIVGQFIESDMQNRVRQLEFGLEKANKLLDDIADYLLKGN